ncbi:transposase [Rhizobium leguminosarum]|uniref:Transposase n=2 Tax=Rhizobium leguminosarum TaxID=384 RepID=A0A7M3DWC0_RHILE|nr:transposase [Rhizobium leguminosarum]
MPAVWHIERAIRWSALGRTLGESAALQGIRVNRSEGRPARTNARLDQGGGIATMLDISVDDRFLFLSIDDPGEFGVTHFDDGSISLRRYPRGEKKDVEWTEFASEHADGLIVRTARRGQSLSVLSTRLLLSLFKPEGRDVTVGEMEDWDELNEIVLAAAQKQFFGNKYLMQRAKNLDYTKTDEDLTAFMDEWKKAAEQRGLGGWVPSASTIRRLVYQRTELLSLADCLFKTGTVRNKGIWPTWVYELADQALGKISSRSMPNVGEAYKWFFAHFYLGRDEGEGIPEDKRQTPPDLRTFRNWKAQATNRESTSKLFGNREANKEWKGTISPQSAIAPLQIVIIDQTEGNIWAAVKQQGDPSPNGELPDFSDTRDRSTEHKVLAGKRAQVVYAVDVYSRKTLGLIITFEPPSIDTFMACLKMVMTPKLAWKQRFPDLPDATDGFGKPLTIVLDNLRVHVSDSVQRGLLSMKIGIEYAALASPEWKSIVERAIGTVKRVMATLPGGFSIDDRTVSSADYQKYAALSLDEIDEFVTHRLITEHHMLPHKGINEPPAYRWASGIRKFGRSMVDDMRMLDLLGRRRNTVELTRNGIRLNGHRYHHPELVTKLLDAYAAKAKKKKGRSATVMVTVLWKGNDVSSIGVIDHSNNQIVVLPNHDPLLASLCISFDFVKAARKDNAGIFDEYYPVGVRAKYLRQYFAKLEKFVTTQTHRAAKKTARLLEGGRGVVIASDVRRFDAIIPVTDYGLAKIDIPQESSLDEGIFEIETPKKRAPSKPRSTSDKSIQPLPVASTQPGFAMSLSESEAYLDRLMNESSGAVRH